MRREVFQRGRSQKIVLTTILFSFLISTLSIMVVRFFYWTVSRGDNPIVNSKILDDFAQMKMVLKKINSISDPNKTILIFGSSISHGGYNNRGNVSYNGTLSSIQNLAFGGMDIRNINIFAEKLRGNNKSAQKYPLIFFELAPFQLTKKRKLHFERMDKLATILSPWEIIERTYLSPNEMSKMLMVKLLGDQSPTQFTNGLFPFIFLPNDEISPSVDNRELKMLRSLRKRAERNDIQGLHFDEDVVESVIECINKLKPLTHKLIVFMPPNNSNRLNLKSDAIERLDALVQYLNLKAEIVIRKMDDYGVFNDNDFGDIVHLEGAGRDKFSRILLEWMK